MKTQPIIKVGKRLVTFSLLAIVLFDCSDEQILPNENLSPDTTTSTTTTTVTTTSLGCETCTYVVPANKTTVDGLVLGIKPGDVICLNAATTYSTYITFQNIVGTASAPVKITNCGGIATVSAPGKPYILRVNNSKFIRVTGGTKNNTYGIRLKESASNGLVMGYLTTNFTVDHIEVSNVGFSGIMAKTDPSCDDATIRGNYTMRNVSFHNNYIHDTGGEGFYIGHTSYNGKETACGVRLPHTIENVKIYSNIVRNSGWDGIQLSSATKGAYIYQNRVENYSTLNNPIQMGGICIGAGTGGVCHSNYIDGGNGPGIVVFGLANNTVHDNIILNAGTMGIFCDERTTPGTGYRFINNTIINPKSDGIRIYADQVPMNLVVNNIIVNPGSYATYGTRSFVYKLSTNVKVDITNNYFTRNLTDVKFVNATGNNFRLTSQSPAVDAGRDISTYNISKDYYKALRFKGVRYDIGAAEF